jgi:RNA 2',3'-cyclic 3'-phosphodiesterase
VKPERARLFAALELPAPVRTALVTWRTTQLSKMAGLRAAQPDAQSLHVTLCFLGSQPVAEIARIAEACGAAAGNPRTALSLGRPLWLPVRRPRVLTVEIDDAGGLRAVQSALAVALGQGGWFEPERRTFLPHVTVARTSRDGLRRRPPEVAPPEPISFVGSTVALMRSHLGAGGASYERLAVVELGEGGSPG